MSREDEVRQVLAQCILQEKVESGEVTLSLAPAQRNCPFCDERISAAARKCPHCQSILDKSLLPKKDMLDHAISATHGVVNLFLWFVLLLGIGVAFMFFTSR